MPFLPRHFKVIKETLLYSVENQLLRGNSSTLTLDLFKTQLIN